MNKLICVYEDETKFNEKLKVFGDWAEIYVDIDLQLEECDYGVPGSPVWTEVSDCDINKVYINDDEYTYKEFEEKFSGVVVKEVDRLIDDAVDNVSIY